MKLRPRWTRRPVKRTGRQSRSTWGKKPNNALKKQHRLRKYDN